MKWVTHQAGALAIAVWFQADVLQLAAMVLGSLVPDLIEQVLSGRNRMLFFKIHRGLFHWFGLYLCLFAVSFSLPRGTERILLGGVAVGALSHLLLDALNPGGVPMLPLRKNPRLRMPLVSTGSVGEWVFLAGLLGLVVVGGYSLESSWWWRLGHFLR